MTRFPQTVLWAIVLLVALPHLSGQAQPEFIAPPNIGDSLSPIVFNNPPPPPPSTGQPGQRSDAGSRGCGDNGTTSSPDLTNLLALVPTQETAGSRVVFGKTAAEYPTFWFYVPQRAPSTATFVLQDQDENPVYEAQVALPEAGGILSVELLNTIPPLESGKPYQWFFKLYCRSISPPDSFVSGWVQRETLSPNLAQQLGTTPPREQVRLYAENGFWFDALAIAVELRRANGSDPMWGDLLNTVGLESLEGEAIAD